MKLYQTTQISSTLMSESSKEQEEKPVCDNITGLIFGTDSSQVYVNKVSDRTRGFALNSVGEVSWQK